MVLKYESEIASLSCTCPPRGSEQKNIKAYRFVFADLSIEKNFLPVLKIRPQRALGMEDISICSGYAISLFNSEKNASNRYQILKRSNPNIYKSLGNCLAEIAIDMNDGLVTNADKSGHFDLHEFFSCNLIQKAVICKNDL